MKFVALDKPYIPEVAFEKIKELGEISDVQIYEKSPIDQDEMINRLKGKQLATADIYLQFTEEILRESPELKAIFVQAVGYNQIDIKAAEKYGIKVYNCAGYNANSVAEYVFGMIINLTRKIPYAQQHVKAGRWDYSYFFGGELEGKTIGVIGSGNVAQRVAKIARGFSMDVIATTKNPTSNKAELIGIDKFTTLRQVLMNSDVVVTAVPLDDETEDMINKTELNLMKKSAILVNTSRQRIVNELALAQALVEERITGAALDVILSEPFSYNDAPLEIQEMINMPNVIVTPHIAGVSRESTDKIANMFYENVKEFLRGGNHNMVWA